MAKNPKVINSIPQPVRENLTLRLLVNTKTEGGIMLPAAQVDCGVVVKISGAIKNSYLHVGDHVYLPRGDTVGDLFQVNEDLYLVIPENYISAVIGSENE